MSLSFLRFLDHPADTGRFRSGERAVFKQGHHDASRGTVEDRVDDTPESLDLRFLTRDGRKIEESPTFFAMLEPAFFIEPRQHRLDRVPADGPASRTCASTSATVPSPDRHRMFMISSCASARGGGVFRLAMKVLMIGAPTTVGIVYLHE